MYHFNLTSQTLLARQKNQLFIFNILNSSPQYFTSNHDSKEHVSNPYMYFRILLQDTIILSKCRTNSLGNYLYGPV